jgi:iron complex outermembrane receptor protein
LLALASVSVAALASPVYAQSASVQASAAEPTGGAELGEIVVTARRRSESLQEVPQTVNAVTSDQLQKLNIKQFKDVQQLVPGLSLAPSQTGPQNTASMRGVTFDVNTGAQPTVAFYLNDTPVDLNTIFQAMYDIGQVEVLKGPQGTTRGVSAPSGAITVTTHKPDLAEYGGYIDVTATDQHGRDVQGAINLPLVKDVLALRVAGMIDQTDVDGVNSLHNSLQPRAVTSSFRSSLSFEPNDRLNVNLTYQHLDGDRTSFSQISGPGNGTAINPPISPEDRLAVQDSANKNKDHYDNVILQADTRILGQHLSYVGSYAHYKTHNVDEGDGTGDIGNILPGVAIQQDSRIWSERTSHEIRLASDPAPGRLLDYTVGAFYSWFAPNGHITNPGPLLPGAFGDTTTPNLAAFNKAYQVPVYIDVPSTQQETSLFGSLTLHLGANTELSGGVRHIWSIVNSAQTITTGNGMINLGALGLPATTPCSLVNGTAGPGAGDCLLSTAAVASNLSSRTSESPTIYNISLSHHFSRDFLVYANTGTSYRPPVASVGIQGSLASSTNPDLSTLSFHPSEKSRAYEVGFKSTLLDGRARLNASLFRQKFHNMTLYVPGVSYANDVSGAPLDTTFNFTQSVNALVQGFDIDTAFQITPQWNISAQLSYADGKVKGSLVPCNVTDASGAHVYNTDGLISLCPGGSSSRLPLWNATIQSEYVHPVSDSMDGFLRGLLTYAPQNKNRAEPDFTVDAYSQLNVYAGVRSHDGDWEVAVFARNAFNTQRALDIATNQSNINSSLGRSFPGLIAPSGYYSTLVTPQREVGINVHYALGSR